jgi:hypothetical protein
MMRKRNRWLELCAAAGIASLFAAAAQAQPYINELYFEPPSGLDLTAEYIELRGTPSASLSNYYLVFVNGQDNSFHTGRAGRIDQIFNLSTQTFSTNGFLTLRQKTSGYTVASGTRDLVNTGSGAGFGNVGTSSIGASDQWSLSGSTSGTINNDASNNCRGFTAMLIRTDGSLAPSLAIDMDNGNNGLDGTANDSSNWRDHWTIVDSIGYAGQQGQAFTDRFYGAVNFGFEFPDLDPQSITYFDPSQHMESGATYNGLGYVAQIAARWGNSTGQTGADWHLPNTTNDPGSGYQAGSWNFRQSGNPHPVDDGDINTPPVPPPGFALESNQGVPYGTILTNTLGAPNYLSGDYNKNGTNNAADYALWRKRVGSTGSDLADNPADGDHSYLVGAGDYTVWREHFEQPSSSTSPGSGSSFGAVPEPTGWLLALLASLVTLPQRKWTSRR